MALTVEASGTRAATVGTEHSEHTNTGAKVFVFTVNTKNMVNDDELELRIYKKVLTGDSANTLVWYAYYKHAQGDAAASGSSASGEVVKQSPPTTSSYSITFTIKQTAGSSRNFDWTVESL